MKLRIILDVELNGRNSQHVWESIKRCLNKTSEDLEDREDQNDIFRYLEDFWPVLTITGASVAEREEERLRGKEEPVDKSW